MKYAFRGFGNHAKKIKTIVNNNFKSVDFYNLNRNWESSHLKPLTNGVFITAPNSTHSHNIEKLFRFNPEIYIYCEKPLINKIDDFSKIKNIILSGKVYPGFNLRRSKLIELIFSLKKKFGKIISLNVIVSYPFALKDDYKNSWKSSLDYSPLGVFENQTVHYFDLAFFLLGKYTSYNVQLSNYKNGIATTSDLLIAHKSGCVTSIHNSYSEILKTSININFEDGCILIDENRLRVLGPVLNLDIVNNYCLDSPLIYKRDYGLNFFFKESLSNSVCSFIERSISNENCIDDSLETTLMSLDFINKVIEK